MAKKYILPAAISLAFAPLVTQAATLEQLEKQVQSMNQRISAQDQKMRVNGFASFAVSSSDADSGDEAYNRGITNENNYQRYSKIGVQMTFNVDSDTSIITQLVSRGENDFATKAEWAYIKHNFGSGVSGKMGRLRKPNYLLSEYFDVGYAMPWVQPPAEVYGVLESSANYDAFELSYDMNFGDWSANAQVQYGRYVGEETKSDDLMAFNYSMNNGTWTFRAGYSQANASAIPGSATDTAVTQANTALALTDKSDQQFEASNLGQFMGLAAMYDNGSILAIAEYTSLTTENLAPDQDAYYAMLGYRFGKVMPFISHAAVKTTDDKDRDADVTETGYTLAAHDYVQNTLNIPTTDGAYAATVAATAANAGFRSGVDGQVDPGIDQLQATYNKEQTRNTFGVRYDYKPGVAVKFQYDMVDAKDTKGEFDSVPADGKVNVMTFSIDTVF